MATMRIEPDLQFIQELQAVGGDSLKKCYQCATCSVACPIAPDKSPFPRKEMVWAQWGLKDKLINNIDIWLCHNCGTCSDLCPRGAKPGDLISALRNMAYRNAAAPRFLGEWMSSAKYLPLLIAIPALIYLVIWFIRAAQLGTAFPTTAEGDIVYGLLFPGDFTIDPVFSLVALGVALAFFKGVKNMVASFKPDGKTLMLGTPKPSMLKAFIATIKDEILTHEKFTECGEDKADRKFGHMALFYGFIALFIVTSVVAVGHWGGLLIGHQLHTPLDQLNPVKILANIGAILLLVGLTLLTKRRVGQEESKHTSSFYDWYLLGVIWAVALTGIGSELFRLAGVKYIAYPVYYLHLISVFMLIAYLPWSKLGHLVYRTAALTYARYIGRKPM
jgi:quinone-modifying oxidoreductase subunit QmoC